MIKVYATQLSYDVSDAEKQTANKALMYFNSSIKLLDIATNHLDTMYTPFKENPDTNSESAIKTRAALRIYRDKAVENFNAFKAEAFNCIVVMQEFSSDTQTIKLIKSFTSSIDLLKSKVNSFVDLFDNLKDKEFTNKIVQAIEGIKKQSDEIREIIDERIIKHIKSDILAQSWVDGVSNQIQQKVEKKTPLLIDLYEHMQDTLNDAVKEKGTNNKS